LGWEGFEVRTERRVQLLDVTSKVAQIVARSDVSEGVFRIQAPV
jgi:thiamine phosphate synthase YjbQ (UPF0047 family)